MIRTTSGIHGSHGSHGSPSKARPVRTSSSWEMRQQAAHHLLDIDILYVSYARILEEFDYKYQSVFDGGNSAKAHLDLTEIVVDGAKGKWKHVLLLDTVASFAVRKDKSRAECASRRFDQYTALRESLSTAAGEALIARCFRGHVNVPDKMVLVDLPYPWADSDELRLHFLEDTSSKSWKMRWQAAQQLLDIHVVRQLGFINIIHTVLERLYAHHFAKKDAPARITMGNRFTQEEGIIYSKCCEFANYSHSTVTLPFDTGATEPIKNLHGGNPSLQWIVQEDPIYKEREQTQEIEKVQVVAESESKQPDIGTIEVEQATPKEAAPEG